MVVLIVLADQLGRSVATVTGRDRARPAAGRIYALYIIVLAVVRPNWVPALPPEARVQEEAGGGSGHRSLLVVATLAVGAGLGWAGFHDALMNPLLDRTASAPTDEVIILSVTVGATAAMVLALGDKALGLGVLSQLSRRVTLMLIPPWC